MTQFGVQPSIGDFVSLTTSGINTHVNIDLDGTGTTYSPVNIATIYNETGLDLATLIRNGNLLVPT